MPSDFRVSEVSLDAFKCATPSVLGKRSGVVALPDAAQHRVSRGIGVDSKITVHVRGLKRLSSGSTRVSHLKRVWPALRAFEPLATADFFAGVDSMQPSILNRTALENH